MKKAISILGAWVLVAMLAATALAQGTGRLNGEILDKDGKPFADQAVTIKNPDTGQTYNLKTDKNGKFVQLGMRSGVYLITLDSLGYSEKYQVQDAQENNYKLDLKQVAAATVAAHPEEAKKKEETEDKFKLMKQHFDAGWRRWGRATICGRKSRRRRRIRNRRCKRSAPPTARRQPPNSRKRCRTWARKRSTTAR